MPRQTPPTKTLHPAPLIRVLYPTPLDHLKAFEPYVEAGFDEIYVANMGPHSVDMMNLYRDEVLPQLRRG